jgi:small-conductance mechanosensitive channel
MDRQAEIEELRDALRRLARNDAERIAVLELRIELLEAENEQLRARLGEDANRS